MLKIRRANVGLTAHCTVYRKCVKEYVKPKVANESVGACRLSVNSLLVYAAKYFMTNGILMKASKGRPWA